MRRAAARALALVAQLRRGRRSVSGGAAAVDASLAAVSAELSLLRLRLGLRDGQPLRLAIGLSGGVDSSLALVLLQRLAAAPSAQAPLRLLPVFMKNWEESDESGRTGITGEGCSYLEERAAAHRAASAAGLSLEEVDFVREYWGRVFSPFLAVAGAGGTPNPDLSCNVHIKFGALADWAAARGCDALATGHYARLRPAPGSLEQQRSPQQPGAVELLRGADASKDQSYFLASVPGSALRRALFPLGALDKHTVRAAAAALALPSADRRSSAGICFVGRRGDFGSFLSEYIPPVPGSFLPLGRADCPQEELRRLFPQRHQGQQRYTHGQGARIGGASQPWFVAGKGAKPPGAVWVVCGKDHPALFTRSALAGGLFWVAGSPPAALTDEGGASFSFKARYAQAPAGARAWLGGAGDNGAGEWEASGRCVPLTQAQAAFGGGGGAEGTLRLRFERPARAVTPGQAVVLYRGEVCVGGGVIRHPGKSLMELGEEC